MKKMYLIAFAFLSLSLSINAQTPLTVASDFTATDVDGVSQNLFTHLDGGKYVLIDFFYTTCGPCQAAAPQANASYEHFGCNNSGVFFLAVDYGDSDAEVIAFGDTYGAHYPAISGDAGGTAICGTYGITAYPTFILIAPNHNIIVQDMWPFSTTICNTAIEGEGVAPMACPAGVFDYSQNIITGLYPNPASEQTMFTFMAEQNKLYTVTVYDLSGKPVLVKEMNEITSQGEYSYSVPVNDLAAGSYYMVLSSDSKPCGRVPLMIVK